MNKITKQDERLSLVNVTVGDDVKFFHFINAYECTIDSGSKVGSFVEIQKNVHVGKNCKISSHSFLCEGVTIADGVFIGHHVCFINDKHPRAVNTDGTMQTDDDWQLLKTHVGRGASIGSGTTIMGGVTIGENAMVGAGSLVLHDVPAGATVAGRPARALNS